MMVGGIKETVTLPWREDRGKGRRKRRNRRGRKYRGSRLGNESGSSHVAWLGSHQLLLCQLWTAHFLEVFQLQTSSCAVGSPVLGLIELTIAFLLWDRKGSLNQPSQRGVVRTVLLVGSHGRLVTMMSATAKGDGCSLPNRTFVPPF